ncbi:MAG: UDP-N-acetylglucosamine--N-acetylmuramyl-(pentapeptide) pyrophosphoryl-undecaprenol N-acetylglucosamine transferase [bacterium]
MKHLLCTGGGTAGHVIPALPVLERARAAGARVSFVGSRSGLEARLLADSGVDYHGIAAGKLRRYLSIDNLADVFRVGAGIWQAWRLLGRLRPDVVFSKGGFVSFPVVFAAWLRRVPVVAHESDLSPGLANRLALPFVRTLCVTFADTRVARFRGRRVVTGTPLREALLGGDAGRGRARLGIDGARPVLLVTGGSLGAQAINQAVDGALDALLADFEVVHVRGGGNRPPRQAAGYHPFEYVGEGWGDLLAAADLVVSRAGANTLYELLALKKPTLLIPLSARVSRGDQGENAAWARGHGYCRVLDEQALTPDRLVAEVCTLARERAAVQAALAAFQVPDAASAIVAELEAVSRPPVVG